MVNPSDNICGSCCSASSEETMLQSSKTPPCPDGCINCTKHLTRPCCVLLEVTQRCNLRCPVCFTGAESSGSNTAEDPSLETITFWYRRLFERAGACHIQLSGGEPTLRDDLDEIIRIGKEEGFSYFQLNTNGMRLAEEPKLALQLKEAGLTCVFLQFDGMNDRVHKIMRGKSLQAIKEAAVDACAAAELPVVLVPTVAGGVNEQELMPLVAYGMSKSPTVRGIHIQPMARFGRADVEATHITNADVVALLQEQSDGMICSCHFSGGNAEHHDCSINAHYFITDEGGLKPSGVKRTSCCDDAVEQAQDIQMRRWGTNLSSIAKERPPQGTMDDFLWKTKTRSFAITGMAFMDEETLDIERLRRCYLFIVAPDGTPIPFCAYNSALREKLQSETVHCNLPAEQEKANESPCCCG